ncbi:MAG: hypothetical protein VX416_10900 [Pseudomonadota bacterium]|nr:hypothetical protein [Pseudomonadota bacterium]
MSYLTLESWKFLIANAFSETCYGCQALLVAFDQTLPQDNAKF